MLHLKHHRMIHFTRHPMNHIIRHPMNQQMTNSIAHNDRTMYRLYDIDFAYSTSPSLSTKHNEQEVFVIGFKLVSMKYQYGGVMAVPKDPPIAVLDKLRHDNPALAHLTPHVYVVCDGGS